jgi:diguanylate cyclase (GGDEF)-like protein
MLELSHPATGVDLLNDEAWPKRDANPKEARLFADRAKALAETSGYPLGVGRSLTVSSFLHYRAGRFAEALAEALAALERLEPDQDFVWLCRLYNTLGIVYDSLGDRVQAMRWLLQQLELSRRLGDEQQEATALHDLGFLATEPDQERGYYRKALELFRKTGDLWGVVLALINLAEGYTKEGNYAEALRLAHEATSVEGRGEAVEKAFTSRTLGNIYAAQSKLEAALTHYHQSLQLVRQGLGDGSQEPSLLLAIGETYQQAGHLVEALRYLEEGLHLAQKMGFRVLVYTAHRALAAYHKAAGDLGPALEHFERFYELKEAHFADENEQKVRAMEVLHRTETARREAALQERKNRELSEHIESLERLNAQVKALSSSDPLTGLYNRRYLFEYLARLEGSQTLSVALLDLDHFKRVNDTFSHFVGDEVLRAAAALFGAALRSADIAARFGGEEFVVVFCHTSSGQALLACERLRQSVAAHPWSEAHPGLEVTVSIGLASGLAKDYETLLVQADKKLYEAKRSGRNRVAS